MSPRLLQMMMVLIASLLLFFPGRSNAETIQLQLLPAEKCVFVPDGTYTYSYDIHGNVDGSSPNLKLSCSGGGAIMVGGGRRGYQGLPVGLESDHGRVKVSTKTDEHGTFHFDKLPAGKYKLTLPDLSPQSVTVGDKGSIGGTIKRNDDGTASITVSDRKPVVVSGQIPSAAGVRVASGDVNGDGVESRKAAPKKAAGKTPIVSTTSGTDVRPGGGDGKLPGLALAGEPIVVNGTVIVDKAATPQEGGDVKPGIAVACASCFDIFFELVAIQGKPDGIGPGGVHVGSTRTDKNGGFHFDQLPAGNYIVTFAGQLSQSFTVRDDGILGGKVMRGSDGSMSIFDRWGNLVAAPKVGTLPSKAAEKPVGFGSGMGAGPGVGAGMGPGGMGPGGMSPGGAMGPGGPMSPGGPMMGGPGGAMGGPKR